jgi:hypothetical protein
MARRTINPKTVRGGVPARRVTVRPVATRKSASIAAGEVGSASGAVTPTKVNRPARVKGCAG